MDYFTLLHLKKEPFSNSPDPEMFFQSIQHQGCLQKLELAIRLRRGLSVVIGDIGTGKSTLSRQIIRFSNSNDGHILPRIILDPEFTTPLEFLTTVTKAFGIASTPETSEWQLKDSIKNYLFEQAVENTKIPVLIIDEGQKLPDFCIEILREFLNYETNQHKLLQIVIFAQEEFQATLKSKPNFVDRITNYHRLVPLDFRDTKRMIRHRLEQASEDGSKPLHLFTLPAMAAIYLMTGGSPRKIVMLCSKTLIALLVKNKKSCGLLQVLTSARELSLPLPGKSLRIIATLLLFTLLPIIAAGMLASQIPSSTWQPKVKTLQAYLPAFISKNAPLKSIDAPAVLQEKPQQEFEQPAEVVAAPPLPDAAPPLDEGSAQESAAAQAPAPPQPEPPLQLPELIGDIAFDQQVTLSTMIARVYGRFTNQRLHHVLLANPDIRDPDHVKPNTLIHFPGHLFDSPPAEIAASSLTENAPSLADAYTKVQAPAKNERKTIVPTLGFNGELSFTVVTEELKRNDLETEFARQKPEEPVSRKALPEIIGSVLFDSTTTLSKMIARIYGRYTVARQKKLLANNPHITDPDQVLPETFIYFPRQDEENFSPGPDDFWLELATEDYLNDAYVFLKEASAATKQPVRIVPAWKNEELLLFKVVLEQLLRSDQEAINLLESLPMPYQNEAIIRQGSIDQ